MKALCLKKIDSYAGICTKPCTKFCPDQAGASVTFCVDPKDLSTDSAAGLCTMKCALGQSLTGCRPGYKCVETTRYNDPSTKAEVCVPNMKPNLFDPYDWSFTVMKDDCSITECAGEFGQVCTEDGGPHCAYAICLEPGTFKVKEGTHCAYINSAYGTSVTCDAAGKALSSEKCPEDKPCNACGTCGSVPDEVCDGADNDCDGEVDEGVLNACGECGDVPEEVCDGVDNDCDGDIDYGVRG